MIRHTASMISRRASLPLTLALAAVAAILSARCAGNSQCVRQSDCAKSETCVFEQAGCDLAGRCSDRGGACGGALLDEACGCDGKVVHGVCGGGYDGRVLSLGRSCNALPDAGSSPDLDATIAPDGVAPSDSGAADAPIPHTGSDAACPPGDASVGRNTCPQTPCPTGWICTSETGGVAGGGGSHCVPIAAECNGVATCECMGSCACGFVFNRAEQCRDLDGGAVIACDNGVR